jgi:hypothetical protein
VTLATRPTFGSAKTQSLVSAAARMTVSTGNNKKTDQLASIFQQMWSKLIIRISYLSIDDMGPKRRLALAGCSHPQV